MNGFSVDTQELRDAADAVRSAVDDFAGNAVLKYSIAPDQVGHPALESALSAFQRTSVECAAVLVADAEEVANRLRATADTYSAADTARRESR